MNEIRRDEIVYEEGWRDVRDDELTDTPDDSCEDSSGSDTPPQKENRSGGSRPILTILQLVLCMAAALAVFILKAMDSDAYHGFMKAYAEEMAKPVISQKVFDAVDWNALFGGSHVTVSSTPDEIPVR